MLQKKYRIAIIGSGPIGKLLLASVKPHPRLEYVSYEAENLPLRPSFGYGIGPQTFATTRILHEGIYNEMRKQSFCSRVWMCFLSAEDEGVKLGDVEVDVDEEGKEGVYGRLGRGELMGLLDGFLPDGNEVRYGMKLKSIIRNEQGRKELVFENGGIDEVDAIWACDGMNSLCRKLIQGPEYKAAEYSGVICFRGKVKVEDVKAAVGEDLATKTNTFVGGKGYFVLVFPIDGGQFVNIAAFAKEERHRKLGRNWKTGFADMVFYFPKANPTLKKLLEMVYNEQDTQYLEIMAMKKFGSFFNEGLNMTNFGDAANGMPPHIAGSMSTGFIGVTTFLQKELNPRLGGLAEDASQKEIEKMLAEASRGYEKQHRPLAQKLCDLTVEQGDVWTGQVTDVEELRRRPQFLWRAATEQDVTLWK